MTSGSKSVVAHAPGRADFLRKDYLKSHKTISTATASRDLQAGVESGLLMRQGDKAAAVYRFLS